MATHFRRCAIVMPAFLALLLLAGAARAADAPKIIADFENGQPAPFNGGQVVAEHASQGQKALVVKEGTVAMEGHFDWSGYDYMKFDVFNPKAEPAMFALLIRDSKSTGYWTWVNFNATAIPGKSTITVPTNMYVGEKSRPGRPLYSKDVTQLAVIVEKAGPLYFDNFRLERSPLAGASFEGLKAFDFGPKDSAVMEAYTGVSEAPYDAAAGFGWQGLTGKAENAYQPDPLYQDYIKLVAGTFRVDLPNGKYHVLMNIDGPGGFWGEMTIYRQRSVIANGVKVVDDTLDYDRYIKNYFRNAHSEDLPGVDPFKVYVAPSFHEKSFDVDVTDGKLELKFQADSPLGIWLSALTIYPQDKKAQGEEFVSKITARRHELFNEYFKQVEPKTTGSKAAQGEVVLFSRNYMQPVNAFDGPVSGEAIPADGLKLSLAADSEEPLVFSAQPGGDLGAIAIQLSAFKTADGKTLKAETFQPGWIDYRITRIATDGSSYTVAPRYWHPIPAPSAPGVTRSFWIRTRTADAAAGTYTGTITVKPEKASAKTIPVTITVLPFKIDAVTDVPVGPFGSGINMYWYGDDPKTQQWNWAIYDKTLTVLKDGGCTTFTGRPHVHVTAANGKITLDTTDADKEMSMARAKGFNQMLSGYGVGVECYNTYGNAQGPDVAAAQKAGFADMDSFLKALWGAIDAHAVQANWLPVAYNLCDEPIGEAISGAALNAAAHKKAGVGLKRTTFMGETSMEGNDPKSDHYKLLQALPIASLNGHDEASIKVVHDAGNQFSFYNGGTRWTFGRYMKALVVNDKMMMRPDWHFNNAMGNPYYALDGREDEYVWFNTDENMTMVPAPDFLRHIIPGLNDYRYLSTLQRLIKENPSHPKLAEAKAVWDEMIKLTAGKDREPKGRDYAADRAKIIKAIEVLLTK